LHNFIRVDGIPTFAAVGQTDGSLSLYDTTTKRQTSTLLPSTANSSQICALSWTGNLLAAGLDGAALLWDIRQPSRSAEYHPISKLTAHGPHKVCGVKWRGDGEMLATSGDDNAVCVWDMRAMKKPLIRSKDGKVAWKKKGHSSAVKVRLARLVLSSVLTMCGSTGISMVSLVADRPRIWRWKIRRNGQLLVRSNGNVKAFPLTWVADHKHILFTRLP
jgi:WD40 repeat protein